MKRYLAFFGDDDYHPQKGMGNFIGDFDSIEEAVKAQHNKHDRDKVEFSWGVVWCSKERKNVYEY